MPDFVHSDIDVNTGRNANSSLRANEDKTPDVVHSYSDVNTGPNVNSSLTVNENNTLDIMQPDMGRMEQERLFEQVSSWMRRKHQALYEQVTISFQFTVFLG